MVTGEIPRTMQRQRTVMRAMEPTDMPTDYHSALAQVTGRGVDLREPSAPAEGWLNLVEPGKGKWLSFSAFGTSLFGVDLNSAAVQAWSTAIGTLEEIDQAVATGTYGLMDARRLHEAQALAESLSSTLTHAIDDLKAIVTPLEGEGGAITGTAAEALLEHLHLIQTVMTTIDAELTTDPSPAVAEVLRDAASALTTFSQQMSSVYAESRQILLNAVTVSTDAIAQNVSAYLTGAGLLPNGQQYQALAPDPAAGLNYAKLVLGRYSSTVAGALPYGMPPISGDLTQPAVWDAAGAAITKLITTEIDKMDAVARTATAELSAAYEKATTRLVSAGSATPVLGKRHLRAAVRVQAPLAERQLARAVTPHVP